MSFFVTKLVDQGSVTYSITTAGYIALIVIMVGLVAGVGLIGSRQAGKPVQTKQIVFAGLAMALGIVTSNIKFLNLPMGGSVTLFSMLFICLIGSWYGLKAGLMTSIAYGFLQLIIDPYIISLPQMLLDYILAFGALGLSGLFSKSKNGLIKGYVLGVFGRYVCSTLSGIIFFGMYAPETMSPVVYSLAYNGMTIGAEGVLTAIVLAVPVVGNAFRYVKGLAVNSDLQGMEKPAKG